MNKTIEKTKSNQKLNNEQTDLVENHIYLAYSRANIMKSKYNFEKLFIDEDDFDSYALEALCYAALNFNSQYGVKFSTFAVSYIDNYIKTKIVLENSTIKLPTYSIDKEKHKSYIQAALNNSLITYLGNTSSESSCTCDSIDFLYKGTEDYGFKIVEESLFLDFLSSQLSESDKKIFRNLILEDDCLSDIADKMNIHINTVWRRKKKIAEHIQKKLLFV